jgi:DNA-binding transcriptional regulator YiaG
VSSPIPLEAKKGCYKTTARIPTSPDYFANGKNTPFASSMVIWEACNLLTSASVLPWQSDDRGYYYERSVKQGRGSMRFYLCADAQTENPQPLQQEEALGLIESLDMRAACLHLIYAAYAMTLERAWEQEFIISDAQIERYLGLDKRKDLSKATKLTLIKRIAQQPCQITASVDWPQQGKVPGFSIPESRLWHLQEITHHFQADEQGCKHLIGLTFRVKAGIWAKYFLNKNGYRKRLAFYQYGTLPYYLLTTATSLWQQHQGAVRMMLWILFKAKMGSKQCITVPTLLRVGYGEEKIIQAETNRELRKRLTRAFEGDLEVLNHTGIKPIFDPVTYTPEIQPLWAKLADLPDDADEALDFWINDGSQSHRLTDASPRGKWKLLLKARILRFDLPEDWQQQLAKLERKKQQRLAQKTYPAKKYSGLTCEQIVAARQRSGLSQRALAQRLGKSQSWIRDLERGRFAAKPEDQILLRKILGLERCQVIKLA